MDLKCLPVKEEITGSYPVSHPLALLVQWIRISGYEPEDSSSNLLESSKNKFGFGYPITYLCFMSKESRQYLGTTITASNYREILDREGRDGINFHTKHLRAYLKGKKQFRHKFMRETVMVTNEKGEEVEEIRIVKDPFGNPRYNVFTVQQAYIPEGPVHSGDADGSDQGVLPEEGTGPLAD
jgi:hypothetical protein